MRPADASQRQRRPDERRGARPRARPGRSWPSPPLGFAVNFWAWALLGPLGPGVKERSGLSFAAQSLLVAVPVIVGSLGRIPVGALTDRFGARIMFPLVPSRRSCRCCIIWLVGHTSYRLLLIGGFFLGIGGTTFAVGVPLVTAWFPPERRGLALGIFGIGMGGTAISAFTTVRLVKATTGTAAPSCSGRRPRRLRRGRHAAAARRARPAAADRPLPDPAQREVPAGRDLAVCSLYAVGFGGFVAFSVYLPAYLKTAYGSPPTTPRRAPPASSSSPSSAARSAAGCPTGSIRCPCSSLLRGGRRVRRAFRAGAAAGAVATIAFLAWRPGSAPPRRGVRARRLARRPRTRSGAVTGIVGAAGGLGGFVPPLIMGAVYGSAGELRPSACGC